MHPPCPPVGRLCRTPIRPLPLSPEDTGIFRLTTLGVWPAKMMAPDVSSMGSPTSAITADGGVIGSFGTSRPWLDFKFLASQPGVLKLREHPGTVHWWRPPPPAFWPVVPSRVEITPQMGCRSQDSTPDAIWTIVEGTTWISVILAWDFRTCLLHSFSSANFATQPTTGHVIGFYQCTSVMYLTPLTSFEERKKEEITERSCVRRIWGWPLLIALHHVRISAASAPAKKKNKKNINICYYFSLVGNRVVFYNMRGEGVKPLVSAASSVIPK
jgi:hypothetical protein